MHPLTIDVVTEPLFIQPTLSPVHTSITTYTLGPSSVFFDNRETDPTRNANLIASPLFATRSLKPQTKT